LLNTDSGIFNQILNTFGFKSVDWLNGEWTSKFSIILGMTWRWTGYNTVIILAGLQSISEDIYEAADIDGANAVQKFLKVTIWTDFAINNFS
jgi:lactose/L-arabinose transport system permease protein